MGQLDGSVRAEEGRLAELVEHILLSDTTAFDGHLRTSWGNPFVAR